MIIVGDLLYRLVYDTVYLCKGALLSSAEPPTSEQTMGASGIG